MLVSCDAAGLEWRVLVELSRDEQALTEICEGQDTHELNRVAFSLPERRVAKFYLFRTIYRGTGWAFAHDPDFMHVSTDPSYWDRVGEMFYSKYSGIDECHKNWARTVASGKSLVGPLGREWDISMGRDRQGNIKIPWTTLTNYPVQGTGADVMMLARISFFRRLRTLEIPSAALISTVHDSIVVDVESKYVGMIAKLFYEVFNDLIPNIKRCFGYDWVVPLTCEVKMGMDMKDMKPFDFDVKIV